MLHDPLALTHDDLDELGRALCTPLWHGEDVERWLLLDRRDLFLASVGLMSSEVLSPHAALELVISRLQLDVDNGDLAASSLQKVTGHLARYTKVLEQLRNVTDVRTTGSADVAAFINLPVTRGRLTAATRDNRRYALSKYYEVLRDLGQYVGDPLAGISIARNDSTPLRPLVDAEVDRCRLRSGRTYRDTRGPAGWAFAEATATTSEIPAILLADLDLARGRVWLDGGARNTPRWGHLTEWGTEAVRRHLAATDTQDGLPLLYAGTAGDTSAQAASCKLVHDTLRRAGLGGDDRVRPGSVPAWAGARLYADTGDLALVASRLGLRSLDDTARTIGLDWSTSVEPPAHRRRT